MKIIPDIENNPNNKERGQVQKKLQEEFDLAKPGVR